jgi:hypothetical protein
MIEKLPRLNPGTVEVGVRAVFSEQISERSYPGNTGGNGSEMRLNVMAKCRECADACNGK